MNFLFFKEIFDWNAKIEKVYDVPNNKENAVKLCYEDPQPQILFVFGWV